MIKRNGNGIGKDVLGIIYDQEKWQWYWQGCSGHNFVKNPS
jgi:hypothetical protein